MYTIKLPASGFTFVELLLQQFLCIFRLNVFIYLK